MVRGGERKMALEVFCRLCAKSMREGHGKAMRALYCEVLSPCCPLVCRQGQISLCCSVKGHGEVMRKVTERERRTSLTHSHSKSKCMLSKKQQA